MSDVQAQLVISAYGVGLSYGCRLYRAQVHDDGYVGRELLCSLFPPVGQVSPKGRDEEAELDLRLRVVDATLRTYGGPNHTLGVTMYPDPVVFGAARELLNQGEGAV